MHSDHQSVIVSIVSIVDDSANLSNTRYRKFDDRHVRKQ